MLIKINEHNNSDIITSITGPIGQPFAGRSDSPVARETSCRLHFASLCGSHLQSHLGAISI
jgi:hypothetical protein